MGFLKNLKDIFNKNIECGDEIDNRIVFRYKKKWLYLSKNIFVRENNACVIVYKGRVCDIIYSGKYKINGDSIPETYGKARIDRQTKKGYKIKKIRADIYFVNLEEFNTFAYMSNTPFKTKSSTFGKIKGCLAGTCNIKTLDAGSVVKTLISHKGHIKNKEIYKKLGLVVGNKINKLIQKNKIPTDMVLNNQEYVEGILNTDMQDALDREGLFISGVRLKAVNFSKKHQGKVNKYLSSHRRTVPAVNINKAIGIEEKVEMRIPVSASVQRTTNSSIMQNTKKPPVSQQYSVCKVCRKRNALGAKICINCGNKID